MRRDDSAGCTGVNQEDEAIEVISDVKKSAAGRSSVYKIIIHRWRGRFPAADQARSRGPGSDGLSLQTADGNSNNSSQGGGGRLASSCDCGGD